jgi:hypothetical protein
VGNPALTGLHAKAQAAQLANLSMVDEFLVAQRAVDRAGKGGVPPARTDHAGGSLPD